MVYNVGVSLLIGFNFFMGPTILKRLSIIFAVLMLLSSGSAWSDTAPGKVTGGNAYSLPSWFKSSFMDVQEDAGEARALGKHLMVFMHLDECPYCDKMLKENFISGPTQEFMDQNFEVIGVNIRGDLEVTWIDGSVYTEMELTKHLKTVATPTMVFLDLEGNKVLQLNGYRDTRSFQYALEYVQSKNYLEQSFADYLSLREKPTVYAFREHPQLATTTFFKGFDKPLAVLFEDQSCVTCDRFHEKTLNHPDVLKALEAFLFVRFDTDSDQRIIDMQGQTTTPAHWVKDLGLSYRPAIVLFNQGKEMMRADGQLYHQHLTESLRYVSEGYLQYDTPREFKDIYREAQLKAGNDVDFAE